MANPTAETIIGRYRDVIRSESGSDVPVIQDTFAFSALTKAVLEYKRAFRRSGGAEAITSALESGDDLVADTSLAENITGSSTDFDVADASDLDSAGAIAIWDEEMADLAFYDPKSGNNLQGVSGVSGSHETGDTVQKLYPLASNFGSFRPSDAFGDGVQVNGLPFYFTDSPPEGRTFSIRQNGDTKYLWLPRNTSGKFRYQFNPATTAISSVTDVVDVPEEDMYFLVWRLAEWGYVGRGDDLGKAAYAKAQADKILLDALKARNIGRRLRFRPLRIVSDRDYIIPEIDLAQ